MMIVIMRTVDGFGAFEKSNTLLIANKITSAKFETSRKLFLVQKAWNRNTPARTEHARLISRTKMTSISVAPFLCKCNN